MFKSTVLYFANLYFSSKRIKYRLVPLSFCLILLEIKICNAVIHLVCWLVWFTAYNSIMKTF